MLDGAENWRSVENGRLIFSGIFAGVIVEGVVGRLSGLNWRDSVSLQLLRAPGVGESGVSR